MDQTSANGQGRSVVICAYTMDRGERLTVSVATNWVVGCSYAGHRSDPRPIRTPIGCNMAFRTEALVAAGGSATDLGRIGRTPIGSEETELSTRATAATGASIWFAPDAEVHHHVEGERLGYSYFIRRCFAERVSKAAIAMRVVASAVMTSERRHLTTLGMGVARRVNAARCLRSADAPLQAGAVVANTAAAGTGFLFGWVMTRLRP